MCVMARWLMVLVAASVVTADEDRWVWGHGDAQAPRIPGYVAPTTTLAPPVTTFRPARRLQLPQGFKSITAHPFVLGPFAPLILGRSPPVRPDGTTKSRVVADTAWDEGAPLDDRDRYTTLDRLQHERGTPPAPPRPSPHHLGGLHPDEVFYADQDLLIIRGGGFNSDVFHDPPQTLDHDQDVDDQDTRVSVSPHDTQVGVSPHDHYNGNIPAFLPPPQPSASAPPQRFAMLFPSPSTTEHIYVPYVWPATPTDTTTRRSAPLQHRPKVEGYVYTAPVQPFRIPSQPIRTPSQPLRIAPGFNQVDSGFNEVDSGFNQVDSGLIQNGPVQPGHSLLFDTAVNFRHPRPPINPAAEVFSHHGRFRQRPRV